MQLNTLSRPVLEPTQTPAERRPRWLPTPVAEMARRARGEEVDTFIKSGRRENYPTRLVDGIEYEVPREPVCIVGDPTRQFFNLPSLRQWDKVNGTHPFTRQSLAGAALEPLEGALRDDMVQFFAALSERLNELGHRPRANQARGRCEALRLLRPSATDLRPLTGGPIVAGDDEDALTIDWQEGLHPMLEDWGGERNMLVELLRALRSCAQRRAHQLAFDIEALMMSIDRVVPYLRVAQTDTAPGFYRAVEAFLQDCTRIAELSDRAQALLDDSMRATP